MSTGRNKNNEFLIQEVDRYQLSVLSNTKKGINTGNDLEFLKEIYDQVVESSINNDEHIVIAIFDYNKNTNIYYYDSEQERC